LIIHIGKLLGIYPVKHGAPAAALIESDFPVLSYVAIAQRGPCNAIDIGFALAMDHLVGGYHHLAIQQASI